MTTPRQKLRLSPGTVHVWIFQRRGRRGAFRLAVPSGSSRGRAPRGESRALLIGVLARYLPGGGRLRLTYGANGRPALAHGEGLDFNLAHSGGCVAVALARHARVGLDIERARTVASCVALAQEVFGPAAARALERLAEPKRSARFLTLWTLLEAAVKAEGGDVSQSFARFAPWALAASEGRGAGGVHLRRIRIGAGYVAAVALDRPIRAVRLLRPGAHGPGPENRKAKRRR